MRIQEMGFGEKRHALEQSGKVRRLRDVTERLKNLPRGELVLIFQLQRVQQMLQISCLCCLRRSILSILNGSVYTLSGTSHAPVTAKYHSVHQRIPEPLIMAYLCASARLRLANCFSHLLQKYVNVDETKVY